MDGLSGEACKLKYNNTKLSLMRVAEVVYGELIKRLKKFSHNQSFYSMQELLPLRQNCSVKIWLEKFCKIFLSKYSKPCLDSPLKVEKEVSIDL